MALSLTTRYGLRLSQSLAVSFDLLGASGNQPLSLSINNIVWSSHATEQEPLMLQNCHRLCLLNSHMKSQCTNLHTGPLSLMNCIMRVNCEMCFQTGVCECVGVWVCVCAMFEIKETITNCKPKTRKLKYAFLRVYPIKKPSFNDESFQRSSWFHFRNGSTYQHITEGPAPWHSR